MKENRPSGFMMDMFESNHVEPMVTMVTDMDMAMADEHQDGDEDGHEGFMVFLPVGNEQATITFTVTDDMVGEWEIGCFELDGVHYDAGMKGALIVKP